MKTLWVVADKDGTISLFEDKPFRGATNMWWSWKEEQTYTNISEEICKTLIGKVPTWEDEPIKIEIKV